jgi:hypothetical protein
LELTPQLRLSLPPQAGWTDAIPRVTLSSAPDISGPDGFESLGPPFDLEAIDPASGALMPSFSPPLTLVYQISGQELLTADGDAKRIKLALQLGSDWVAPPCSADATHALSCTLTRPGRFALVVAPAATPPLDVDVPGGHVYRQANGFDGAGSAGFAVLDDDQAQFWTELQRLGGVERVGYPVSARFEYGGYWTQAFQNLVLQSRPEWGRSVPVNVLDELNTRGLDDWLDAHRQVPPAADTSGDTGLAWEVVVARHLGLLDGYPELRAFYDAEPDALETFGLPLSVKDYGGFVAVRLQRATFQLWRDPNGPRVVVGNAGDLAKEVGLWPVAAVMPLTSPVPSPPAEPSD